VAILSAETLLRSDRPDLLVLSGDRTELAAFGLAALLLRIPLAHLHGGEITAGAVDEAIRHSLTKMATWHFAAAEAHADRIAQLGEERDRIFTVGAPALDGLRDLPRLSREEVCGRLELDAGRPTGLVTFHPPTIEGPAATGEQLDELLAALDRTDLQLVFTGANADAGGAAINSRLEAVAQARPDRYRYRASLGGELYYSCLRHLNLMVGNSSSGLVEAPSFGLPVVNVGDRQEGRVRAGNVINVAASREAIAAGIAQALGEEFRLRCAAVVNPYAPAGVGSIGRRIKEILKTVPLTPPVLKKRFITMRAGRAQVSG
jgi:UDP-hydrolysing UDP-N-acetyl-D-glucosamine 2-epimerase